MVKVIKNGSNLYCRLPKEIVKVAGLGQGQEVLVQYSRETEQITIKKI